MKYLLVIFGLSIGGFNFAQSKISIAIVGSFEYNNFKYKESFLQKKK